MSRKSAVAVAVAAAASALTNLALAAPPANDPESFSDATGIIETYSNAGRIDTGSAFFQSLGTNGRSCSSCHVASEAMGLSAAGVRARYVSTRGKDPIFAPVDGANCPNGQLGSAAAHSLLLGNGLIRVGITLPAKPEFTISVVHDPYGCAITTDAQGDLTVSVYRRPLPSANLSFLSAVMFDGRETVVPLTDSTSFLANLVTDLTHQALDATNGHAQAAHPPSNQQLADIVHFELGLFSAQRRDNMAGNLSEHGGLGGARNLAQQEYYPGINDALGGDPTGQAFNPSAMSLFASWAKLTDADAMTPADGFRNAMRAAIAAGEKLFNTFPITITNVRGLNDNAALGKPTSISGHCSTCHDAPNVGDHSLPVPLDIGTSHSVLASMESDRQIRAGLEQLSVPNLPVYLISGCPDPFNAGESASFYTSDPGKALVSGLCSDFNRIKGPILRGLAARAPYFHNGAAATLMEAVDFYNERFEMGLTREQKAELVAFLNSL